MYSMSCAPLTCCSIDAATDCDTTSALAPGKTAFTVTWGGATCGYWAIGRPTAAKAPTRTMSSAMTVENTGRSIKKLSMACALNLGRCDDRFHRRPWTKLAKSLHHYPISGGQAARDHPVVADTVAGDDLSRLGFVARCDHVHRLQSLQFLHRLLRDADRAGTFERSDADPYEQARPQEAIGIGHRDTHLQRSALLIHRGIDEAETTGKRVVRSVRQPDVKWRFLIGPLHCLLQLQQPL